MLTGFARTRWPRLRFSESYAVRISLKISRICEFRVIMGIMTGLLGCCSSSTLGSRANDYVKTLAMLGFWLHHSPCSLGCWKNNTLAARSLSPKHTRQGDEIRNSATRLIMTEKCVCHYIPELLCKTPNCIIDKFDSHSLQGFSLYVKKYLLTKYANECTIRDCYVCKNWYHHCILLYWPLELCLYNMMHMFLLICYSFTGACQYKQPTSYDWLWIRLYVG